MQSGQFFSKLLRKKCPRVYWKENDHFLTNMKCALEPFVNRELPKVELALYNSWAPIDVPASEVINALRINWNQLCLYFGLSPFLPLMRVCRVELGIWRISCHQTLFTRFLWLLSRTFMKSFQLVNLTLWIHWSLYAPTCLRQGQFSVVQANSESYVKELALENLAIPPGQQVCIFSIYHNAFFSLWVLKLH